MKWVDDPQAHQARLASGIALCADAGSDLVCLPELTLNRYPAETRPKGPADIHAEVLETGPTLAFTRHMARTHGVAVQASLYEKTGAKDGRGFNTAIVVSHTGDLIGCTRKLHIPITEGYFENHYFENGPAAEGYPVHRLNFDSWDLSIGIPTCWDEWFPEVARSYALAGVSLLVYPTAIGSEPDFPGFDTQPILRANVTGHAISNGLFIAVPNRVGTEGRLKFYGSSFLIDPFGRCLIIGPRDEEAALVASINLNHREDWLTLFPFFKTRRPDTYGALSKPIAEPDYSQNDGKSLVIPGLALHE